MFVRSVTAYSFGLLFSATLLLFLSVGVSMAEPQVINSQDAVLAQSQGELIIVDIRTPGEWIEDGIAAGAHPLDMRDRGFVQALQQLMDDNPGVPVALICATGVRSHYVATALEQMGLPPVIDISEGMHGSNVGSGWLAQGLPIEPYERGSLLERLTQ